MIHFSRSVRKFVFSGSSRSATGARAKEIFSAEKNLRCRKNKLSAGFTLVELVIYVGLTAIVIGLFGGIMITVVRVQSQQTSSRQVGEELAFVMNVIKRDVRDSTTLTVATTTLTIGNATTTNPIVIDISSGVVRKSEAGGTAYALTTNKVVADSLTFTNLSSGSSQAVRVTLTLSYASSTNPQRAFTQTLQATAAPLKKTD